MKKLLSFALALGLLLALAAPALAAEVVFSPQNLEVDGAAVACEMYNIDGRNYFKLRDLAKLLNGTGSQFDVDWDEAAGLVRIATNRAYTAPDGHELVPRGDLSAAAQMSAQKIMIDGVVRDDLSVWNIGGSNFFQLRELGGVLGFAVDYDYGSDTARIMSIEAPEHVRLVGVGETAYADLDGDGAANAVRVWLERNEYGWFEPYLTIDGTDYTEAMYEAREGNHFDAVDEYWWAITDLDGSDGCLEIAIQDWGPSDDLTTSFFRFDGKQLSYLGAPEGFLFFQSKPGIMTLNGDGTLRSELRLSVLQTWWTTVTYAVGADGRLAPVPQDFYTSTFADQQTEVLIPLVGYDAPGGTKSTLPSGAKGQIVGTDDAEWVKLLVDGSAVWLRLLGEGDYRYQFEGLYGPVYCWEALSDLCMAD